MPRESRAGALVCGPGRATLPVRGKPGVGKIVLLDYPAWRGLGMPGGARWGGVPEMELTFTRPRWLSGCRAWTARRPNTQGSASCCGIRLGPWPRPGRDSAVGDPDASYTDTATVELTW